MDDERARVTLASRFVRLVGVSDDTGTLLQDDQWNDDTMLLNLEVASLVGDRWSLGARAGLGRHVTPGAAGPATLAGVGDLTAVASYEWLPEWAANSWLPRGVAFAAITAPTGAADANAAAPLGRGYWSVTAGTSLAKTLRDVDVFLVPQLGMGFRQVAGPEEGQREVTAAASLGVGYTFRKLPLRLALRLDPQVRWPQALPERWSSPLSADVSVLLNEAWRVALTYEDQTIFPLHRNASLGRGIALAVWHRWLR